MIFDREIVPYETSLNVFRGSHDPAQRIRQGSDIGTQYRS
jgi:peptide-methionine (S)-S-oxide reductase